MSSKILLEIINFARLSFNENPVRLNDFNSRIADELEDEHYETFVVQNTNNTKSIVYGLTIDQCMLIGMRESKAVRKNVLATLKQNKPLNYLNLSQHPVSRRSSKKIEEDKPKIEYYEKL